MAIIRWEPFREIMDLRRSMERLFDDYSYPAAARNTLMESGFIPLDIYQTEDAFIVKGSLPGIKPEDVDISITGDTLTIKGETKQEEEVKEENYVCREHRYGTFSRMVALPGELDAGKSEATFDNGVLTLTIPKSEEKKPKQIKIKAKGAIEAPRKTEK
jgi:HSP20 family protein